MKTRVYIVTMTTNSSGNSTGWITTSRGRAIAEARRLEKDPDNRVTVYGYRIHGTPLAVALRAAQLCAEVVGDGVDGVVVDPECPPAMVEHLGILRWHDTGGATAAGEDEE